MLSSLGPGTTADEFRMQLNLLQESVPALRDQKEEQEQAATSEEFKVQLRYLSRQCDFAIQILDDEKAKYMGNMVVLHQELQVKTAAEAGAFDGDWKAVEATDYWPGEVLKRLQELVERRPLGEKREAYVKEIEAYWKDFAGKEAAQLYQKG